MRLLAVGLACGMAVSGQAQLPPGAQDTTQTAPLDAQAAGRAAAEDALEKGNFAGAVKLLAGLVEQSPKDARLRYDLGYAQDSLDQTTNAEASYRAAIGLDAGLVEAHLGLGLLLARTGQGEAVRNELGLAAEAAGGDARLRARAYRAMARLDLKARPDAARDELLAALRLTPETADDTLMAAELAEDSDDGAAAEKEYRRVLAGTPNDPTATAGLAHLVAKDRPGEAEAMLSGALSVHPGDAALSAQMASVYAAEGKYGQAVPLAEALHAANPADANLTRLLAHLYAESGEPGKAEPLYAALLSKTMDATLLDDRADALIKLRRYAEAQALLERAVADPTAFPTREGFAMAASHLAFAASNNQDPRTVLRALDLRATVLPRSPSSMFLTATAYDKLHEYRRAADSYREFLAAASGKFPDEEFEARHRLIAIEKRR